MAVIARSWRAHRAAPRSGGPVLVLVGILAGLGTAAAASPDASAVVVPTAHHTAGRLSGPVVPRRADDLPTAIAVDADGTSYVGFAAASALVRISPKGKLRHRVPLDRPGAVDALAVTAAHEIWVDYGDSVSLLDRHGRVQRHFAHDPAVACNPAGHDPGRYGGIATHHQWVYVASRCDDTVQVYRRTGRLHATLRLPGDGAPRGIAYGAAQAGRGARLYVALPDRGEVVAFAARGLSDDSTPVERLTPARPRGGSRPVPGGLVADRGGQLVVSDLANQALYFYDTNHQYSLYRTLGHPPRPSRRAGSLNLPVALAQHARDGGPLSSNLFIADADNRRVQRWETGGYTYWTRRVRPTSSGIGGGGGGGSGGGGSGGGGGGGSTGQVPELRSPPELTGSPVVGGQLHCSTGGWSGSPTSYTRVWVRDGAQIAGETGASYVVSSADAGTQLWCTVRARNAAGAGTAASTAAVEIPGGAAAGGPVNVEPPAVLGTPQPGKIMLCDPGQWDGDPTFGFVWLRTGAPVGTGQTYDVTAADVGQALACVVTATNAHATVVLTTPARLVSARP